MSEFETPLKIDAETVRAAYKFMLRRDPDSEEAVRRAVEHFKTVEELETSIRNSDEWRSKQIRESLNASSQKITKFYSERGYPIFVDLNDVAVSGTVWLTDHFEPHVEHMIVTYTDWDKTFLDVGANIGWFSIMVATQIRKYRAQGTVEAFEANPRLAMVLSASIIENNLIDIATVRNVAVSDQVGMLRLFCPGNNAAGGKILDQSWQDYLHSDSHHSDGSNVEDSAKEHRFNTIVPAVSLDELYKDFKGRIGTIKLDVEGHEPLVLKGAIETLRKHRPKMFIEVNPTAMDLSTKTSLEEFMSLLNQLDYDLYDPYDDNLALTLPQIKEKISAIGLYTDFLAISRV